MEQMGYGEIIDAIADLQATISDIRSRIKDEKRLHELHIEDLEEIIAHRNRRVSEMYSLDNCPKWEWEVISDAEADLVWDGEVRAMIRRLSGQYAGQWSVVALQGSVVCNLPYEKTPHDVMASAQNYATTVGRYRYIRPPVDLYKPDMGGSDGDV